MAEVNEKFDNYLNCMIGMFGDKNKEKYQKFYHKYSHLKIE